MLVHLNASTEDDVDVLNVHRNSKVETHWQPLLDNEKPRRTMGQNKKKHRINSHVINHYPTSEEVSERANE